MEIIIQDPFPTFVVVGGQIKGTMGGQADHVITFFLQRFGIFGWMLAIGVADRSAPRIIS
jgi:hypothetical protein